MDKLLHIKMLMEHGICCRSRKVIIRRSWRSARALFFILAAKSLFERAMQIQLEFGFSSQLRLHYAAFR